MLVMDPPPLERAASLLPVLGCVNPGGTIARFGRTMRGNETQSTRRRGRTWSSSQLPFYLVGGRIPAGVAGRDAVGEMPTERRVYLSHGIDRRFDLPGHVDSRAFAMGSGSP